MAQTEYHNIGPIYLTEAKYEEKRVAGELVTGQEYRILDWYPVSQDAFDATIEDLCSVLEITGTKNTDGSWSFTR